MEPSDLFRPSRSEDEEKTDDSKEGRSGQTRLEELHTLTLYYLAQVGLSGRTLGLLRRFVGQ